MPLFLHKGQKIYERRKEKFSVKKGEIGARMRHADMNCSYLCMRIDAGSVYRKRNNLFLKKLDGYYKTC